MTEFDPLTEQQLHLFLRIDAAIPTDPVLRAAAELWQEERAGKIMPASGEMGNLPNFIRRHAFEADLAVNGDRRWIVSGAGTMARPSLGMQDERPGEISDKRVAVRLRHLFDLVSQRAEPYSVMFETEDAQGARQLVEVYAAPLATGERSEHRIFAVLNCRTEAKA